MLQTLRVLRARTKGEPRNLSAGRSRSRAVRRQTGGGGGRRPHRCPARALPARGGRSGPGVVPADHRRAAKAEAQQVYGEIIQLDQDLSAADEKLNLANLRLQHVSYELKVNHRELVVARRNLGRSRTMIQQRLVSLYTTTTADDARPDPRPATPAIERPATPNRQREPALERRQPGRRRRCIEVQAHGSSVCQSLGRWSQTRPTRTQLMARAPGRAAASVAKQDRRAPAACC